MKLQCVATVQCDEADNNVPCKETATFTQDWTDDDTNQSYELYSRHRFEQAGWKYLRNLKLWLCPRHHNLEKGVACVRTSDQNRSAPNA